jgi:transposase
LKLVTVSPTLFRGGPTRERRKDNVRSADGLPIDPAELRAFAQACQGELKAAQTAVQLKALEIEKLKFQIAKLRRMQFGRSSERISRQIEQLEFRLEELETGAAEDAARAEAADRPAPTRERVKPKRNPLPDHLPRQDVVHQPADDGACTCPDCGRGMARLGEDVTEVLAYVPGHFQVILRIPTKAATYSNLIPATIPI